MYLRKLTFWWLFSFYKRYRYRYFGLGSYCIRLMVWFDECFSERLLFGFFDDITERRKTSILSLFLGDKRNIVLRDAGWRAVGEVDLRVVRMYVCACTNKCTYLLQQRSEEREREIRGLQGCQPARDINQEKQRKRAGKWGLKPRKQQMWIWQWWYFIPNRFSSSFFSYFEHEPCAR